MKIQKIMKMTSQQTSVQPLTAKGVCRLSDLDSKHPIMNSYYCYGSLSIVYIFSHFCFLSIHNFLLNSKEISIFLGSNHVHCWIVFYLEQFEMKKHGISGNFDLFLLIGKLKTTLKNMPKVGVNLHLQIEFYLIYWTHWNSEKNET